MSNSVNTFLSQFDDSKRTVAKLMARENISVQVLDGAKTATFDTVRRVLTIPNWANMTVEQMDLLISHEIGHALFSDNSYLDAAAANKSKRGWFSYLNVVEDCRIERKMKNSFPGLVRTFYNGYREFHTNGPIFKGTRDSLLNTADGSYKKVAELRLIDRINLFFKVGVFMTIPFSAEEKIWLTKIEKAASMQDAIAIADALYALQKEKQTEEKQNPAQPTKQPKSAKQPKSDETDEQSGDAGDDDSADDTTDKDEQSTDDGADDSADADGDDDSTSDDDSSEDSDNAGDADDDSDADSTDSDESGDADADDDSDADGGSNSDDDTDATDSQDDDSNDDDERDATGTDGDGAGKGSPSDDIDEDPIAETAEQMEKELDAAAEQAAENAKGSQTVKHLMMVPVAQNVVNDRTISAAEHTTEIYDRLRGRCSDAQMNADLTTLESKWNETFLSTAKDMAQHFNMKKNARQSQRAMVAKSGRLDVNRLHAYKFSQDIFMRSVSMPKGQSHGIAMVIDGSGSMDGCMKDVLDQTMLFAQFAFLANIPFEAYMFSDRYMGKKGIAIDAKQDEIYPSECVLFGLINTNSDRGTFKKQMRATLALQSRWNGNVTLSPEFRAAAYGIRAAQLNGTPLYASLMLMERHVARMKSSLRLDKMIQVVISDGGDGGGLNAKTNAADYTTGAMRIDENRIDRVASVVRDSVTKKNFVNAIGGTDYKGRPTVEAPQNGMLALLLDVTKARHSATNIYFHLENMTVVKRAGSGSRRRSRYGWQRAQQDAAIAAAAVTTNHYVAQIARFDHGELDVTKTNTDAVTAAVEADGHYVLPKNQGVGDLTILMPTTNSRMGEKDFESLNTDGMSQKAIAKAFTSTMTKSVSRRKFVNAVIPFII